MHLAAFRVLYFVVACGSSSKVGFYCGFLFDSPHDISQSMRNRKYEFAHDVIRGGFFFVSRRFASRIHEISDLEKKLSCSVLGPNTRG